MAIGEPRRVPAPPGAAADRAGRQSSDRNFYDRNVLQRPRPQRRDLRDHGARLLPEPRHQGRLPSSSRSDGQQTALHFSDLCDGDRLNQHVGSYRVEVEEPLQRIRIQCSTRPRGSRPT